MTVSNDRMIAILAMDSYNRGYEPGIAGLGVAGTQASMAPGAMRRLVLFVSLVLAALSFAGCQDHTVWKQKRIVTVETPSGDVTGASVVEVKSAFGQIPMSANEVNYEMRGEAAIVEVAPGRYLFALLDEREKERFYIAVHGMDFADRGEKLAALPDIREVKTLNPDNYPTLVAFTDIADPKTVKEVKPDDLAAAFGPGYALKTITMEITDEKVTKGEVEKVLGWLDQKNPIFVDFDDYPADHPLNQINKRSFVSGG